MTITIQLDEKGRCAIDEHRQLLSRALATFSEKEVDITIKELTVFSELTNTAIELQNEFSRAINSGEKRWSNEDFTVLRSKMSVAYFSLIDSYAQAKVNEKTAEVNRTMLLDRAKVKFAEEGNSPSISTTKAKASDEYEQSNKTYLAAYEERVLLEELLGSLDKSMNAISGIQKHDVNKLKF